MEFVSLGMFIIGKVFGIIFANLNVDESDKTKYIFFHLEHHLVVS